MLGATLLAADAVSARNLGGGWQLTAHLLLTGATLAHRAMQQGLAALQSWDAQLARATGCPHIPQKFWGDSSSAPSALLSLSLAAEPSLRALAPLSASLLAFPRFRFLPA